MTSVIQKEIQKIQENLKIAGRARAINIYVGIQGGPTAFYTGYVSIIICGRNIQEIERDLSNSTKNTSISGVNFSGTTLYTNVILIISHTF